MAGDLAVGKKAPDFSLPDQDGSLVSLKSLKGKQIVLYFHPKDNTSGCTKQACGSASAAPVRAMLATFRTKQQWLRRMGCRPKRR